MKRGAKPRGGNILVNRMRWLTPLLVFLLSSCAPQRLTDLVAVRSTTRAPKGVAIVRATIVDEWGTRLLGIVVHLSGEGTKTPLSQATGFEGTATFEGVRQGSTYEVSVSVPCKKRAVVVGAFSIADEDEIELFICLSSQLCPEREYV